MRRHFAVGLVVALSLACLFTTASASETIKTNPLSERAVSAGEVEFVKGEILVKYKDGAPQREMTDAIDVLGLKLISSYRGGVRKFSVPADGTEQEMIDLLRSDPNVECAHGTHVAGTIAQTTNNSYGVAGKKVKTLKSGHTGAGTHIIRWDGTDEGGRQVAAGIYFCRVIADKEKVTRKMIFAR